MTVFWIVLGCIAVAVVLAWILSPPAELIWVVDNQDWPASSERLDPDEVLAVLDEFTRYYPGAVASLADVVVPGEETR